jgi:hypothetical protein
MSLARNANPPSLRLHGPDHTARMLRKHFAAHNRQVLMLAGGTLLAAAAAWTLLYLLSSWLFVVAISAAGLPYTHIPRGFVILFAVAALCAIIYTWIDQRLTPNERARDKKKPGELISDFLLAVPRMTLAIGGTLTAWQRLDNRDLAQAATLLHRLAEEKRLPMSGVRLDISDPDAVMRILFALQITQVIEAHRDGAEFWLKLNPLRPEALRLTPKTYADA